MGLLYRIKKAPGREGEYKPPYPEVHKSFVTLDEINTETISLAEPFFSKQYIKYVTMVCE